MNCDDAYANGAYIPNADEYVVRWEENAREWRGVEAAVGRARLNLPYGPGERHRYDLFYPAGQPKGTIIFVHGGYWRAFGREYWSHLAQGATGSGWACAIPSYDLAPEVSIAEITRQIRHAVEEVASEMPGALRLAGHSAGGHLVARMLCADVGLAAAVVGRIERVMPISPLVDLRPLIHTAMNEDFKLDEAAARAESPVFMKRLDVPVTVWVGADERPAFLKQARWLAEAWSDIEHRIEADRHHFDVIEGLMHPETPLMRALLS